MVRGGAQAREEGERHTGLATETTSWTSTSAAAAGVGRSRRAAEASVQKRRKSERRRDVDATDGCEMTGAQCCLAGLGAEIEYLQTK